MLVNSAGERMRVDDEALIAEWHAAYDDEDRARAVVQKIYALPRVARVEVLRRLGYVSVGEVLTGGGCAAG